MRVRLTTAVTGGDLLIRATALDHHKQMFFQSPTEHQAIQGLKSKMKEYEERQEKKADYPRTIEVEL